MEMIKEVEFKVTKLQNAQKHQAKLSKLEQDWKKKCYIHEKLMKDLQQQVI